MENSFEKRKPEIKVEQEKPKFKYSPENPPSLDVLREKVFLVHATTSVPEQDILRAQARDNTTEKRWGNHQKPPSFRPTLHFSMGELFSGGWEGGFSREKMPCAILLPLQKGEQQLFNVFPNDTIIMGDIKLDETSFVVIPDGMNYEGKAKVVSYDPKAESLRDAVSRVIAGMDAWQMHTDTFLDGPHSFASCTNIESIDISDKRFFEALLQEHPNLSFGSHFHSERGDAWRTGVVDYRITDIMNRYSDTLQNEIPTPELSIWRNLIAHNLRMLDISLAKAGYPDEVMRIYEKEKEELNSWLNVVDADLYARENYGKTITSAKKEVWEELRDAKENPAEIKSVVDKRKNDLQDSHNFRANIGGIADALANMPHAEFKSFVDQNNESFNAEEQESLKIAYVIKRWLIVKTEQAKREGLDVVLEFSVQNDAEAAKRVMEELEIFLTHECNRLGDALEIIRMPFIQSALSKVWGVKIGEISNLSDLLVIHPETSALFQGGEIKIDSKDEEAYSLLKALGEGITEKTESTANYKSFKEAASAARNKKYQIERISRLLEEVRAPINTARDPDKIGWGETMTYYEILKRDNPNVEAFFGRLGLAEKFRKMFPTDQVFWNSDKSLMLIYKELQN